MTTPIEIPVDRRHYTTTLLFAALVIYLVVDRLVPANFVLPIDISVHLSQLMLILLGMALVLAISVEVLPGPRGVVGGLAVLMLVLLLAAPFINALGMTEFEVDGAQRGLVQLILFTVLFAAAYQLSLRDTRRAHTILVVVVALTALQVVMAIFESVGSVYVIEEWDFLQLGFLADDPKFEAYLGQDIGHVRGPRPTATAPHPIVLSSLIGMSILLVLAKYPELKRRGRRGVALAAIGLLMVGLFILHTRTGFAVLLVGGLVAAFLVVRHSADHIIRFALAGLAALFVAVLVVPGSARTMLNLFSRAPADTSVTARVSDYALIGELLERRPFLGAGFMTRDPQLLFIDNSYLDGLLEFGLVAGLVALAFLVAATVRPFRAYAGATSAERTLLASGAVAGVSLLVAMALFDALKFAQFLPGVLVMLALGVGTADDVLRRSSRGGPAALDGRDSPLPALTAE